MRVALLVLSFLCVAGRPAHADEVILQWFETPWAEVEARMPQVAAAGYRAIWLPPPEKGADGIADVGFALFDRFDLGNQNQRGTIRTRYGTLEELQSMVRAAHRHGIRVYLDTVMNHNSNPARVEFQGGPTTPAGMLDFPGMTPLDFHVLPANPIANGGFRGRPPLANCPNQQPCTVDVFPQGSDMFVPAVEIAQIPANQLPPGGASHPALAGFSHLVRAPTIDFGAGQTANWCAGPRDLNWVCASQLINYSLLGLIDVANNQYVGPYASSDGTNPVTGTPLISYIRNPDRPDTYPNNTPVAEEPRQYLMRWIRWMSTVTDADGFRLDAIKHTPETFFAEDFAGDPIAFNKAIQDSFDERRGNTDTNDDDREDDAAIFGESFSSDDRDDGELKAYRNTGMRVLDFPLFFKMRGLFGPGANGGGDLGQLTFPRAGNVGSWREFGGLGRNDGVAFLQSHDECQPSVSVRNTPNCLPAATNHEDLLQAYLTMRVGDSVVYFDGNNFTEATFVRAGRPDALGDLSPLVPALVRASHDTARGGMFNRQVDDDLYAFERVVEGLGASALVILHDNVGGDGRVGGDGVARIGANDPRPFVVTAFPPGTVLEELTGNAPLGSETLTVLDPAGETQTARNNAYAAHAAANGGDASLPAGHGFVYLGISNNSALIYAPVGALAEDAALQVLQDGNVVAPETMETVGSRSTHLGLAVPPSTHPVHRVGGAFDVRVAAASTAESVSGIQVDHAIPAGLTAHPDSSEGVLNGTGVVTASATGFVASVPALPAGLHHVELRVVTAVPGAASRLRTLHVTVLSTASLPDAGVPVDAGSPADASVRPDASSGVVDAGPGLDASMVVADAAVLDAAVPDAGRRDASVVVVDGSVPDAASVDGGLEDEDRDGIPRFRDNCPEVSNPAQTDFDGDQRGDACDLCPNEASDGTADGCLAVTAAARARLERMMDMSVGLETVDNALDLDGNGTVDAVDIARAIRNARAEVAP